MPAPVVKVAETSLAGGCRWMASPASSPAVAVGVGDDDLAWSSWRMTLAETSELVTGRWR